MKLEIKMVLVMLGVAVVSGGLLAMIYGATYDIIAENSQSDRQEALSKLMPEASEFKEQMIVSGEDTTIVYHGYDGAGEKTGIVFTVSPRGFAGPIETMVGLKMDTTVSSILVISMSETPGLGAGVTDSSFCSQYMGLRLDEIFLTSAGGKVEAITASTISSNAVTGGVREGVETYMPYLTIDPDSEQLVPEPTTDTLTSTAEIIEETPPEDTKLTKKVISQTGYVDEEFTVIVYIDDKGKIARVEIPLDDFGETANAPQCCNASFLDQFIGLSTAEEIAASVDAVSGATYSSDSVKAAVAKAVGK